MVVPQRIARRELLDARDPAGYTNGEFKIQRFLHRCRWIHSIKSEADPDHVVMGLGKTNGCGGIGGMGLKVVEALSAQRGQRVVE